MDSSERFYDELRRIQHRFPGFKIVPKSDSVLCTIIYWFLRCVTLGRLDFRKHFHTVLGKTLYAGDDWVSLSYSQRWVILRHEQVHLEQARRLGLGCFWLGWVVFALLYLFVLPAVMTFRAWFELEAYRESAFCGRQVGIPMSRAWLRSQLTGANYLWMCVLPWVLDYWLDRTPCLDP